MAIDAECVCHWCDGLAMVIVSISENGRMLHARVICDSSDCDARGPVIMSMKDDYSRDELIEKAIFAWDNDYGN